MAFVAKRIHILGICGTFMGSLAQLAKALGHQVSGSDTGVYPPMSDQLIKAGIHLSEGFDPKNIPQDVDLVIIGNALSRGNPSVEYVLEQGLPYTSGPQWLGEEVLQKRWVLAVAGTHGKTTTSSMLAWILEYAGMQPGFLIGGVPENFEVSARLGGSPFFVIEASHPNERILQSFQVHHQLKIQAGRFPGSWPASRRRGFADCSEQSSCGARGRRSGVPPGPLCLDPGTASPGGCGCYGAINRRQPD